MANLEGGLELSLAVVIESGAEEMVRNRAEELDIGIEEELPSGVLLLTVPSDSYDSFVQIPGIQSITLQDGMEIME